MIGEGFSKKLDDSIERIEMRRRDVDDAAEFNHRAKQRVGFKRAAGFDILQHRGLMRPTASAPAMRFSSAMRKRIAERFADRFYLAHHVFGELSRQAEAADVFKRRMGQRADRVERRIAPKLCPKLGADIGDDWRLKSGLGEGRGDGLQPFRRLAIEFGEGKTIAFDVPDDAGALDLCRG